MKENVERQRKDKDIDGHKKTGKGERKKKN